MRARNGRRSSGPVAVIAVAVTALGLVAAPHSASASDGTTETSVSGRYASLAAPTTVNPRDFGAAGDGAADDTAALQAALDTGGLVDLGPGTFRVTGNLYLRSGGGVTGGADSTLVLNGTNRIEADFLSEVQLTGFTLQRDEPAHLTEDAAIKIYRSDNITIDGITILDHRGLNSAIFIAGRFEDTSDRTSCHDVVVRNVTIRDYQRTTIDAAGVITMVKGTGLTLAHCKDYVIENNSVIETKRFLDEDDPYTNFQGAGLAVISSIDGTVRNNYVELAGQGIDIGGGKNVPDRSAADIAQRTEQGYRGTQRSIIEHNTVVDIYGPGIKLVNDVRDNIVRFNTVRTTGLTGIWITAGTTAAADHSSTRGNVVEGNHIVDPGGGFGAQAWREFWGPDATTGTGIMFEGAFSFFTNLDHDARPQDNVVRHNTIVSNSGRMPYGISDRHALPGNEESGLPSRAVNNIIENNLVRGAEISAFDIDPARNTLTERGDETKPTVSLVGPTAAGPLRDLRIEVTAEDDFGVRRVVANIYRGASLVISTQTTFDGASRVTHAAAPELDDGAYTVRYNAHDLAGNVSATDSFAFTVDRTAPTVAVKSDVGETVSAGEGYDSLSLKLHDAGGIDRVEINGKVKNLTDDVWSDVNGLRPGVFGAVAGDNVLVAYDLAGNSVEYVFVLN